MPDGGTTTSSFACSLTWAELIAIQNGAFTPSAKSSESSPGFPHAPRPGGPPPLSGVSIGGLPSLEPTRPGEYQQPTTRTTSADPRTLTILTAERGRRNDEVVIAHSLEIRTGCRRRDRHHHRHHHRRSRRNRHPKAGADR